MMSSSDPSLNPFGGNYEMAASYGMFTMGDDGESDPYSHNHRDTAKAPYSPAVMASSSALYNTPSYYQAGSYGNAKYTTNTHTPSHQNKGHSSSHRGANTQWPSSSHPHHNSNNNYNYNCYRGTTGGSAAATSDAHPETHSRDSTAVVDVGVATTHAFVSPSRRRGSGEWGAAARSGATTATSLAECHLSRKDGGGFTPATDNGFMRSSCASLGGRSAVSELENSYGMADYMNSLSSGSSGAEGEMAGDEVRHDNQHQQRLSHSARQTPSEQRSAHSLISRGTPSSHSTPMQIPRAQADGRKPSTPTQPPPQAAAHPTDVATKRRAAESRVSPATPYSRMGFGATGVSPLYDLGGYSPANSPAANPALAKVSPTVAAVTLSDKTPTPPAEPRSRRSPQQSRPSSRTQPTLTTALVTPPRAPVTGAILPPAQRGSVSPSPHPPSSSTADGGSPLTLGEAEARAVASSPPRELPLLPKVLSVPPDTVAAARKRAASLTQTEKKEEETDEPQSVKASVVPPAIVIANSAASSAHTGKFKPMESKAAEGTTTSVTASPVTPPPHSSAPVSNSLAATAAAVSTPPSSTAREKDAPTVPETTTTSSTASPRRLSAAPPSPTPFPCPKADTSAKTSSTDASTTRFTIAPPPAETRGANRFSRRRYLEQPVAALSAVEVSHNNGKSDDTSEKKGGAAPTDHKSSSTSTSSKRTQRTRSHGSPPPLPDSLHTAAETKLTATEEVSGGRRSAVKPAEKQNWRRRRSTANSASDRNALSNGTGTTTTTTTTNSSKSKSRSDSNTGGSRRHRSGSETHSLVDAAATTQSRSCPSLELSMDEGTNPYIHRRSSSWSGHSTGCSSESGDLVHTSSGRGKRWGTQRNDRLLPSAEEEMDKYGFNRMGIRF